MKKTSWFIFFLFFAVSCLDEPECFLLNNDIIGVYFRVLGSNRLDSAEMRRVLIYGRDRELIAIDEDHDTVVTNIQLPLDYFDTQTSFSFSNVASTRNLQTIYKVQSQFVSEDCGPRYIVSDLDVLTHDFDSVRIVSRTPNNTGAGRNIEVFRCPITDTLTLTINQLLLPATAAGNRSRIATANIQSITVDDAAVITPKPGKATLQLPVNLQAGSTTYRFTFGPRLGEPETTKELKVNYTTTTIERFKKCGEQTFVSGLTIDPAYANSLTDSASIAQNADLSFRRVLTDPYETNINIFRCPPTNIMQLAFRRSLNGTLQGTSVELQSITADYTTEIFYAGATVSVVQLPLNPNANSTVFTLNYANRSETITVNYTRTSPPATIFRSEYACSARNIITNLTVAGTPANIEVPSNSILFPPVTNLNVEIPQ